MMIAMRYRVCNDIMQILCIHVSTWVEGAPAGAVQGERFLLVILSTLIISNYNDMPETSSACAGSTSGRNIPETKAFD